MSSITPSTTKRDSQELPRFTENPDFPKFAAKVRSHRKNLFRKQVETVQVNIGKLCNQACSHCHVDSGPNKTRENMGQKVYDQLVSLLKASPEVKTIDLTGGAPELNPFFRPLVTEARALGLEVIDRCNLTVLSVPGQEDTAQFLRDHAVHVVASLPCYSADNVDKQRGDGVFEASIIGLQTLNALGYGKPGEPKIDLVYNPLGASLPGPQKELEESYKKMLWQEFDIVFNSLYCITNMPIKRFLFDLKRQNKLESYMQLLLENFNPNAIDQLMCKNQVSVSWDGKIFDCDFNQMLNIPVGVKAKTLFDLESFEPLEEANILTADHCYGCTAGAGSSCTGALVD